MLTIISNDTDPFLNLAAEDGLLDRVSELGSLLFLWRSRPAVVIGKHQNPWRECRLASLEATDTLLARRISGGGTVYLDEGGLNYAWFTPRAAYDPDRVYGCVLAALDAVGVCAERMGKSSLGVQGRKISGNAFCYRRDAALHHGTLLVSSDLEALHRALTGRDEAFDTHAVASEPAPVVNLAEGCPTLTTDILSAALVGAFTDDAGAGAARRATLGELALPVRHRRDELAAWSWCYGRTPAFSFTREFDFDWGRATFAFDARDGEVETCRLFADTLPADLLGRAGIAAMSGHVGPNGISVRISDSAGHDPRIDALARRLAEWGF